jgi:F-type H+-transporting ATPase subunit epsilon
MSDGPSTFRFEIVTPQDSCFAEDVSALQVPAEHGRLAVLAGHQPMLCSLRPGTVTVTRGTGERETWAIGAGTMTVAPDGVSILAREIRDHRALPET